MEALYRALLYAYPRAFRQAYGAPMLDAFRVQRRRASREASLLVSLRFWFFVLDDWLRSALLPRLQPRRPARGGSSSLDPRETIVAMIQEIRHAARRLVASPAFSLTAVAIVALGIGANAAIFSFVDAVLLRPLPYADPERIVAIYQDSDGGEPNSSSFPAYRDMKEHGHLFSGVTAVMTFGASLVGADSVEPVAPEYVTSDYFTVLGLRPILGRDLEPADELDGGEPVAILSYDSWQRRFGGDPGVLGSQLRINGSAVTVVGVGPRGYGGIFPGFNVDMWMSLSALRPLYGDYVGTTFDRRGDHWFQVRARLADGVTVQQARAAMESLAARLARDFPEYNTGRDITVFGPDEVRFHPSIDTEVVPLSAGLMAVVGLVLLIACSNLANLLLVRATSRSRDVSVRLALGASRSRIFVHVLTESVLLALAGGLVGIAMAWLAMRAFLAAELPLPLPGIADLRVDMRLVSFSAAVALATGVLFGILPALRLTRADVAAVIKENLRPLSLGGRRVTLGKVLVVGQITVSFVVLVIAGLYLRSLGNAQRVDIGVDVERLATLQTDIALAGHPAETAPALFERLRESVASLPAVENVALAAQLPVRGGGGSSTMVIENYTPPDGTGAVELERFVVSPGYFRTMGIALLHGRPFEPTDTPETPRVLIASAAMARAFWGRTDVVGQRLRSQGGSTWFEIVGVVDDVPVNDVTEPPTPLMYTSLSQGIGTAAYVIARTRGNAAEILQPMRERLLQIDPQLRPLSLQTMSSYLSASFELPRLGARVLLAFGALGLGLASLGLYALVAFAVGQRREELGIRMALGANRNRVISMVMREVMTLVAIAVALGTGVVLIIGPSVADTLYRVPGRDPVTIGLTIVVMVAAAMAATFVPARRAAWSDPVRALRQG